VCVCVCVCVCARVTMVTVSHRSPPTFSLTQKQNILTLAFVVFVFSGRTEEVNE